MVAAPAWKLRGNRLEVSMSNLPDEIQSATRHLLEVLQGIESRQALSGSRLAQAEPATLNELKSALDYTRQVLWTYIQAQARSSGADVEAEVQSLRLQRVTEMLHTIQEESNIRPLSENPATVSFLNAVHEIADAAFERHAGPVAEKAS
jgi:biotin operon repressor